MSKAIVLYLHVHQPFRVRPYSIFDAGVRHDYFASDNWEERTNNERILRKVADKSYLPTNAILLELLHKHPQFKLSLSITGTVLEQMEMWAPDALKSFQDLVATGRVEIVGETYHHSLAFFFSRLEFEKQVTMHREAVRRLFKVTPTAFRNTELSYSNDVAYWADKAGYKAVLAEGWDPILGWRSPNYVYQPSYTENIRLLMKNYRLSDDIAFRFSDKNWNGWPLTAQKFTDWIKSADGDHTNVNLFMDYETFGEHQWDETGIFDFLRHLPDEWLDGSGDTFMTVTEAAESIEPRDHVDVPYTVTWADTERDLSAWLGNHIQIDAMRVLYAIENDVLATHDHGIIEDWRKLQSSDHAYYMCTKWFKDGDVHAYFSPYSSPYDAYLYYMNAIRDVAYRAMLAREARALRAPA